MSAADDLRKELEQDIKDNYQAFYDKYAKGFLAHIKNSIKLYGKASFYCHGYVSETKSDAVVPSDERLFKEFIQREGFKWDISHNGYGARKIDVYL